MRPISLDITKSTIKIPKETTITDTITVAAVKYVSFFEGMLSFLSSSITSLKKLNIYIIKKINIQNLHPLEISSKHYVAGARGIEPPTNGFGDRYSTS